MREGNTTMAAGTLPRPGTKYGPCRPTCAHTDCAATRNLAQMKCRICGKRIGYNVRLYQEDNWQQLVHAVCLEEQIDAEREKMLAEHHTA